MQNFTAPKLAEITIKLNKSKIPWGIFAGAAALVYGSLRTLEDIDILIPSDAGELISEFFPKAELVYCQNQHISALHLPDIEIIAGLTKGIQLEMDAEMIARISRQKLLGVVVSVLSVEDNIVFKAVLGRGPEIGKHDWEDIAIMLKHNPTIDWAYLVWRLEKCTGKNFSRIAARLDAMQAQS